MYLSISSVLSYLVRSASPRDADDGVVGSGREVAADLGAGRRQAAPLPAGQTRALGVALGKRVAAVARVARHRPQVRRPVHVADGAAVEFGELSAVDELAGGERPPARSTGLHGSCCSCPAALLGARQHLGADEHVARQARELDLGADRAVVAGHAATRRRPRHGALDDVAGDLVARPAAVGLALAPRQAVAR